MINSSPNYSVFEEFLSLIPDEAFENILLLGCCHLLPSIELLIKALIKKGLQPKNISLIGKCYTASQETIYNLQNIGVEVDLLSQYYDSYESYDSTMFNNLENFIKRKLCDLASHPYKKIIILDDGGNFHLMINRLLGGLDNIVGVEQTSKGVSQLNQVDLNYPVINVARSAAKLNLESPMVAEAVLSCLNSKLNSLSFSPKHTLIIGNGVIGSAIFQSLKKINKVTRLDNLPEKSDIELHDLDKISKDIDLVIGATGNNILPLLEEKDILKNDIILASASSTDIEFGGNKLRLLAQKTNNCHDDIYIKNIILLNSGFPINFLGSREDKIPLNKFQLTLSLLLAGIYQAVNENLNETKDFIINLNADYQQKIYFSFSNRNH